ncbi:MAG: hypothetical protein JWO65_2613 [Sphingomonas bacterium]|jgi:hypothetical protein|nr:hypothetical protein [Sphingomonas bacterium]
MNIKSALARLIEFAASWDEGDVVDGGFGSHR